jgi:threonine dehydratase
VACPPRTWPSACPISEHVNLPTATDVTDAAARIAGAVHRTPVLRSRQLDERCGAELVLKCEHLQKVGAFKARGAANALALIDPAVARHGVACHSSGNHGQAVAWAARAASVPAWVVMPEGSSAVKLTAVAGYGAEVIRCGPNLASRAAVLAQVIDRTGATQIHPYDDPGVIAGAGTAALELVEEVPDLEMLLVPIGGGGLASGTTLAAGGRTVWGAEPAGADDAARALDAGRLVDAPPPDTIADGLRATLSDRTFAMIVAGVERIATVTDDEIRAAMRFVWERTKQLIEPSSAVPVAVALRGDLAGRRVGIILTGGNVDLDALTW